MSLIEDSQYMPEEEEHQIVATAALVTTLLSNLPSRPLRLRRADRLDFAWFHKAAWYDLFVPPKETLIYAAGTAEDSQALLMGLYWLCMLPIGMSIEGEELKEEREKEDAMTFGFSLMMQDDLPLSLFILARRLGEIAVFDNDHPLIKWPFASTEAREQYLLLERHALACLEFKLDAELSQWMSFLEGVRVVADRCVLLDRQMMIRAIDAIDIGIDRSLGLSQALEAPISPDVTVVLCQEIQEIEEQDVTDILAPFGDPRLFSTYPSADTSPQSSRSPGSPCDCILAASPQEMPFVSNEEHEYDITLDDCGAEIDISQYGWSIWFACEKSE